MEMLKKIIIFSLLLIIIIIIEKGKNTQEALTSYNSGRGASGVYRALDRAMNLYIIIIIIYIFFFLLVGGRISLGFVLIN
eukprot:gene11384-7889_t